MNSEYASCRSVCEKEIVNREKLNQLLDDVMTINNEILGLSKRLHQTIVANTVEDNCEKESSTETSLEKAHKAFDTAKKTIEILRDLYEWI